MRFACLLLIAFSLFTCTPSHKAANGSDMKLAWSEEFNYNGLPDSTKWSYETGGHGWGNNELQYYTRASLTNAEVSNGTLKIRALREPINNREYSSARLVTRGKAEFTYGKIEIRAK